MNPDHHGTKLLEAGLNAISRATVDGKHAFRTVTLATANPDPEIRILILRDFDRHSRRIRLYTDFRSPKVEALQKNPKAALLFWDPKKRIQIRLQTTVAIQRQTELCKALWNRIPEYGKGDYSTPKSPGSPMSTLFKEDTQALNPDQAFQNFTLLDFTYHSIDLLKLDREGHQRWLYIWETDQWKSQSLTP